MPRPSRMSPGIPRPTLLPALLILLLSAALALTTLTVPARAAAPGGAWTVREPGAPRDGVTAVVRLDPADGTLTLTARKGAVTVLEPAPLGIVTSAADLTSGLRAESRRTRQVTERYSMTTGKQLRRTARMTETRFTFTGRDGARLQLVVRVVADDGVAYRYVLPGSGTVTVEREASAFRPPADARAWLTPYSVNYERLYAQTTAAGAAPRRLRLPGAVPGRRHLRPAHRVGRGRPLRREPAGPRGRRALHRAPGRPGGDVRGPAGHTLAHGRRRRPRHRHGIHPRRRPRPRLAHRRHLLDPARQGRLVLAGRLRPPAQRDLAAQQRFVDLAAAHGWPYTLVDDGWKTTDWMPELIAYARERGVDVLLWVHYTDLDTAAERAEFLPRVTEWGAAGLKIDFMDSDSQERFRWYDDILEDTARYRLLVNFHGATLPKGIQRTWPHVLSLEAVYGAEQGNVPAPALTALPYTRNVVGSMDYTPMGFQFGTRTVSDAAELALSVVFESGFQNFAGSLAAYRERPELARFLEQVPTVWDETRLLSGRPGEGATFARRHGDRWFLGSVHAGAAATERVPLDFLGGGRWLAEVVRDGEDGALLRERHVVTRRDALEVPTAEHGGFAAQFCRATPGRDTCDEPVTRLPLTALTADPVRAEAEPGGTAAVTGRFAVERSGPAADVRLTLDVPDGWTVDGGDATAAELPTGQALSGDWTVRVPSDVRPGGYDLTVRAEYRAPDRPGSGVLHVERPVRVFVPEPGVTYVSDLPFTSASNGWGPVERDGSNGETDPADGGPLALAGTVYDKGLGMHAAGEVVIELDGGYRRFTAEAGIDDEVGAKGSVAFEVLGDGRSLLTTGVLHGSDPAFSVDVDVTGVRQLTLRVLDGGDGVDSDHADWADARLVP